MDLKKIIGINIIRIRHVQNLTQTALADKINLSRKQLCRIERGETYPSEHTLQQIADGLGVPVKELFTDPESPKDYDIYTHSQRALEKLLPTISRMLADEILDDIIHSKGEDNPL
ncbi:MAG: helix-turn-helix domain-containing protein [Spirochaetales bacterium]|nr:helix-turn-helix domain-containing protein [Spirochaetales bacterium]